MRTIFAEYNPGRNSIDVYTSAGYMLRIDTASIDEPLKYARLYLDGNLQMWVDAEDSLTL